MTKKVTVTEEVENKVVSGTGVGMAPERRGRAIAVAVEEAMQKAVAKAQAEGVTDPDEIKVRMFEARKAALDGTGP